MQQYLNTKKSATNLSVFRLLFGILMVIQVSALFERASNYIRDTYIDFPYYGLEFIQPIGAMGMNALVTIGLIAAILVALGLVYRYALVVLGIVFSYYLLLDQVYYDNYTYLLCLFCLLLLFTNANWWTAKNLPTASKKAAYIPNWQYLILQAQIFIVFFYNGLSKMNTEWLSGNVIKGKIIDSFGKDAPVEILSSLFSWSGMLFYSLIGFLLFWKKTRKGAIIAVIAFTFINGLVLQTIGLLPISMVIAVVLLFGDKNWLDHRLLAANTKKSKNKIKSTDLAMPYTAVLGGILGVYFIFQVLFPLRHHLMPGNPEWNGQGHYFAWRMNNYDKNVELTFQAFDGKMDAHIQDVDLGFNRTALQKAAAFPHMVLILAQEIDRQFAAKNLQNMDVEVRAVYKAALNSRPSQSAIKGNTNLGKANYNPWQENDWILPLK